MRPRAEGMTGDELDEADHIDDERDARRAALLERVRAHRALPAGGDDED